MHSFHIFLSFCILSVAKSQKLFSGPCPSPTAVPNFNVDEYAKIWYLVQKYESGLSNAHSCQLGEWTYPVPNGDWNVNLNFTERLSGLVTSVPVTVSFLSKDGSGYLNADTHFSKTSVGLGNIIPQPSWGSSLLGFGFALDWNVPYWVIDTDYKTYAVEWTCQSVGLLNIQYLWVFSTTGSLTADCLEKVRDNLDGQGISANGLVNYDTSGCNCTP